MHKLSSIVHNRLYVSGILNGKIMFSRFVNLDLFYLLEFLIWELSVLHYEEGDICT